MADIKLKCGKCGSEVSASEFARIENLLCKCGGHLQHADPLSAGGISKPNKTHLAFKTDGQIATEQAAPPAPEEWRFSKATAKTEEDFREKKNIHLWLSWLLFVVLAGSCGYFRYWNDALSPPNLALLQQYGPYVFMAVYISIILKAFKDTVFQGLLCLIPFYPFYYTIMVSDDFYFRATVLGLMAGIGQDSIMMLNGEAERAIKFVQNWIATGG